MEVGAEPSAIQTALEAPNLYGAGNVEVTGGSGAALGLEPYVITFKGLLSDQLVTLSTEVSALLGFAGKIDLVQKARGRPDGEITVSAENLGDQTLSGAESPVTLTDVCCSLV